MPQASSFFDSLILFLQFYSVFYGHLVVCFGAESATEEFWKLIIF